MAANLEDQLIDKVRALPPTKQHEALRLLDTLASGANREPNGTGGGSQADDSQLSAYSVKLLQ